ncbi:MAG TPA: outer membrane lipoprotein chaperone LolA [Rhodanobacteraceae bacterium]
MKRFALVSVLALLAVLAAPVCAATGPARAQLEAFAHDLHSLTGHFQQTLMDVNQQTIKSSAGTLALEAPRQFRWQTTTPYKQLIVADGGHVWMYEPDLDQVTVRNQDSASGHSPLTVLTDIGRLDKDFTSFELGTRQGLDWLELKPKSQQAQFAYVELGFDATGLREMQFKDLTGNITRIVFSDWKRNPALPASTFNFTPPKGADVIGDTSNIPQVHPLAH